MDFSISSGKIEVTISSYAAGAAILNIYYTEDYNVVNNTSTISITRMTMWHNQLSSKLCTIGGTITADGYTVFSAAEGVYSSGSNWGDSELLGNYPIVSAAIPHNSDGSKTVTLNFNIDAYCELNGGVKGWNMDGNTGSVSLTLTSVPRPKALSISQGTGSTISVSRTVANHGATAGDLSNGASIYSGDVLKITFGSETGYNLATHTVNGTTFTSGNTYNVSGDVSVVSTATVKSYTLTMSAGTGSTITVNRTSSPKQGASIGNLSNGATIYHFDILQISFSANTGYNVGTLTVNGSTFTSGNSHTVIGNVVVSSTASVKSYKLSISADKGSTITVNRTSSPKQGAGTGTLSNGATIYYDDVLKITFASTPEYEILVRTVNGSAFTSGGSHTVTGAVAVATTTRILGIIYIDNGTTFEKYMVFVDNGTSWDQYIPYIDNGTGWDQYS